MKIVVCNYRYFVTGGPERYMFSLFDLLEQNGHQTIPFSVAYAKNRGWRLNSKWFGSLTILSRVEGQYQTLGAQMTETEDLGVKFRISEALRNTLWS